MRSSGARDERLRDAEALPHPSREAADLPVARLEEVDAPSSSVDARRRPARACIPRSDAK